MPFALAPLAEAVPADARGANAAERCAGRAGSRARSCAAVKRGSCCGALRCRFRFAIPTLRSVGPGKSARDTQEGCQDQRLARKRPERGSTQIQQWVTQAPLPHRNQLDSVKVTSTQHALLAILLCGLTKLVT